MAARKGGVEGRGWRDYFPYMSIMKIYKPAAGFSDNFAWIFLGRPNVNFVQAIDFLKYMAAWGM